MKIRELRKMQAGLIAENQEVISGPESADTGLLLVGNIQFMNTLLVEILELLNIVNNNLATHTPGAEIYEAWEPAKKGENG